MDRPSIWPTYWSLLHHWVPFRDFAWVCLRAWMRVCALPVWNNYVNNWTINKKRYSLWHSWLTGGNEFSDGHECSGSRGEIMLCNYFKCNLDRNRVPRQSTWQWNCYLHTACHSIRHRSGAIWCGHRCQTKKDVMPTLWDMMFNSLRSLLNWRRRNFAGQVLLVVIS